jgi:glycosyltransferase involved in cell wall biosynthesis
MTTRRVVMFTPTPSHEGGAAKHTRTIATGLADRGWEVTVIARRADGRRPRRSRIGRARAIELPGFGRRRAGAIAFLALGIPLGLLRGRRAVYISLELASQGLAAATCATLTGSRYVGFSFSSGRGGEVEHFRGSRLWPLRRFILRRAHWLIGQTPAAASELRAILPEERIAVVPTPVEAVDPPPLSGTARVLFTGRLTAGKGLDGLLDAWELVLDRVPDARLTIAGSAGGWTWGWPPVEEDLRSRVAGSPRLRRSVELTGWVADVADLLAAHDVYVYPSLSEGMSNSLLEAGSWLRVIVASDLPANRAVLGDDYPLLFPVGDSTAMAERLLAGLGDEALRAGAVERLQARMPTFYADAVLDRIEDLLGARSRR